MNPSDKEKKHEQKYAMLKLLTKTRPYTDTSKILILR